MDKLTQGSLLARNTIWNLSGQIAPLVVAIFAIPLLIKGLGTDRFGVLTLAWVVIGYFSLFDLGLGRALTQSIAKNLGAKKENEIPFLAWTGIILVLIIGLVGTLILALLSPWLVYDALKIPKQLQPEILNAFYLLSLAIPVVTGSTGFRGILEAYQRFDLTNLVRIPLGIFTFLGPVLVILFTDKLFPVVAILVIGRLIACIVHLILCLKVIPVMRSGFVMQSGLVKQLIHFGSWMTVSNIISPAMVYFDRFLIGALISITAVAYYATPFEVITKFLLIPAALSGVLFPAFSANIYKDPERTVLLFGRGIKYIFICLFPVALIIVTLASQGLTLWLGAEFAERSFHVLRWLTVGVFINGLAHIPFALIQGIGRPDLTAKLHIAELLLYLPLVWFLIGAYGIVGAAIAWTARMGIDAIVLFIIARHITPGKWLLNKHKMMTFAAVPIALIIGSLQAEFVAKVAFLMLILSIFIVASWFLILAPDERLIIEERMKIGRLLNGLKKR
jgi:O-antigen/teichoic acid export membrane protein